MYNYYINEKKIKEKEEKKKTEEKQIVLESKRKSKLIYIIKFLNKKKKCLN